MSLDPAAIKYVRRGARIGGAIGGGSGAVLGGAAGALPSKYTDLNTGQEKKKTVGQRVTNGVIGAGAGGYLGYSPGRLIGAIHHANKWIKGHRPRPTSVPDWLKGAKTKAEGRKAYHAQARKMHPDLHGGDDAHIKSLNVEWGDHEQHFKTAMLLAFADELEKIAAVGAILGGAAGYQLSPNTAKGKLVGTLVGAGAGHVLQGAGGLAKKKLLDEPHEREQRELYGYQPYAQGSQAQNFY